VRLDLRGALHTEARLRSHRALLWSAVLAVLVVVAAGISSTVHFGGPRWVPHFKITHHQQAQKLDVATSPPPPRVPRSHAGASVPLGVVLGIIIAIAVIGLGMLLWRLWMRRPSRPQATRHAMTQAATTEIPTEPEPEPDTPALRSGIELALQMLDEQREPADAIVRAWLGLQESAEESGIVRRPAETPTEFTSRILSRAFADDRAVRTLLRLYLRTRFGDHPVTDDDVATVRAALEELFRTWPAPHAS
jgi:hypothetical protein